MAFTYPESPDDLVVMTHPEAGESQPTIRSAFDDLYAQQGWTIKEVVHNAGEAVISDAPAPQSAGPAQPRRVHGTPPPEQP